MFRFNKSIIDKNKSKVCIFLNGWEGKNWQIIPVAFLFKYIGYCSVIYSYDNNVLSPDISETVNNIIQVKKDVINQIRSLEYQGTNEFVIFGTSLGSLIGVLVANESKAVSKLILNSVGADFAETVWTWDAVLNGFKKQLLKRHFVTLKKLKQEWMPISPIYNINNLKDRKLLIYLSKRDEIIPYEQGLSFSEALRKRGCNIILRTNINFNHLISCFFNLYNIFDYKNFLKE